MFNPGAALMGLDQLDPRVSESLRKQLHTDTEGVVQKSK